MADIYTPEKRSEIMSKVKSRNTKPEKRLRQVLHGHGFRFGRVNSALVGKPDIILPVYKTAIFVHGCFWHQHTNCKKAALPKSNVVFWTDKLGANIERDKRSKKELECLGWKVYQIWECEISSNSSLSIDSLINDLKRKKKKEIEDG